MIVEKTIFNIPHKTNPRGRYAFKFINGYWLTSTRLNTEISDEHSIIEESDKRTVGKMSAVTYTEAKHIFHRINNEGSSRAVEARMLSVNPDTALKAMELYEGYGQLAFTRFE